MGITFWVPDAPTHIVREDCPACDGTGREYHDNTAECPYCKGAGFDMVRESTLPSLHMSNHNALSFLAQLVKEPDYCGSWSPDELPLLETRLKLIMCGFSVALEEDPRVEGNAHYCGRDSHYVDDRLGALIQVVKAAHKANLKVVWG